MQAQAATRQTTRTRTYTSSLTRAAYKPRIQHLGHGFYRVQSASNPATPWQKCQVSATRRHADAGWPPCARSWPATRPGTGS